METIICSAIWYNDKKVHDHQPRNITEGYVMCGRRHHNIIHLHQILTGKKTRGDSSTQGFLTSLDRFVNRKESALVAKAAGQIKEDTGGLISEQLYSEGLY